MFVASGGVYIGSKVEKKTESCDLSHLFTSANKLGGSL